MNQGGETPQDRDLAPACRQIERIAPRAAKPDEPLSRHTTMRIGGPADLWVKPRTVTSALDVLSFCQRESVPHIVLGKGSNVVVSDSGYRGVVINLAGCFCRYRRLRDGVKCGAGLSLSSLVRKLAEDGFSGLEFAVGIPGTVGGAVATNAGAHGAEMSGALKRTVVMMEGEQRVRTGDAIPFSYREAGLAGVVLEVELSLEEAPSERVRETMGRFMDMRKKTQPIWERTAGCVFKNPPGESAGRIIDSLGLKGTTVGGAKVSELHANFIVNSGGATAADVVALIELIRGRVAERTGNQLELEVQLVGDFVG